MSKRVNMIIEDYSYFSPNEKTLIMSYEDVGELIAEINRLRKAEAEASLNHRIHYARAERLQAAVDGLEEENDALREALELKGAGE